ncbi:MULTISPECIES: hypothetical protein [Methylobacterium]|uniref:Uncharacterized protein n=1 Tax=Methylobacterium thuringiense TaxID=1003091 RepID=A0ABQ4TW15_9HYPH|nr:MULTISPECIES: hypothetical protein [Methylobacterium]TXN24419.1 hypothetical protein FV217_02795 [Methylobacterium sp. WL9]GJE57785.1 hypothetical protein EKPJFOCH_4305 [Methylobacterium thuringiense]
MYRVMEYRRRRGPGQSLFGPRVHTAQYASRSEAGRTAEAEAGRFAHHGYNGEQDYWWGWNEADETGLVFVVETDPTSKIA